MNILADRYQFRARIIPEFLTALPFLILIVAYIENLLVLGFLSLALFFIFFQGHFSSRLGRKLEMKLLSEKNLTTNSDFLLQLYKEDSSNSYIKLMEKASQKSDLGNPFDLQEGEEREKKIDQIIVWLKEGTRDIEKFPAVFDKLCDYGFYRNMLAMRIWAMLILLLSFLLLLLPTVTIQLSPFFKYQTYYPLFGVNGLSVDGMWTLLAICWIVFWMKVISLEALKTANQNYIETLLKSASSIESEKTSST